MKKVQSLCKKKGLLIYLPSIKTELAINFLKKTFELLHLAKNRAGAGGVNIALFSV